MLAPLRVPSKVRTDVLHEPRGIYNPTCALSYQSTLQAVVWLGRGAYMLLLYRRRACMQEVFLQVARCGCQPFLAPSSSAVRPYARLSSLCKARVVWPARQQQQQAAHLLSCWLVLAGAGGRLRRACGYATFASGCCACCKIRVHSILSCKDKATSLACHAPVRRRSLVGLLPHRAGFWQLGCTQMGRGPSQAGSCLEMWA